LSTLNTLTVLINVEVFRYVAGSAVRLLQNITPDCASRHRRLVIRVILPPFIPVSVKTNIRVMNQGNIPEERMSSKLWALPNRSSCTLSSPLLPVSRNALVGHRNLHRSFQVPRKFHHAARRPQVWKTRGTLINISGFAAASFNSLTNDLTSASVASPSEINEPEILCIVIEAINFPSPSKWAG